MRPEIKPEPLKVEFLRICCGCGKHLGTSFQTVVNSEFVQMQLATMGKMMSHGLCENCEQEAYKEIRETANG